MEIVYRRGEATVADVLDDLPDPPSYSAVRAVIRILEEKGHLRHFQEGPRYVYRPRVGLAKARTSAARQLLNTFFPDSPGDAVATLLDLSRGKLSEDELAHLEDLIADARKEGR
jgi:predicted transcriptional regulator